MFGGLIGIRLAAVVLLRLAFIIHKLSTRVEQYPRAAMFVSADHIALHAEACMHSLNTSIESSKLLLEPTAVAHRISNIPDVSFHNMLATPESREMAPISPVEAQEPTDSMLAVNPAANEDSNPPVSQSKSRPKDAEVCLAVNGLRVFTHLNLSQC